MLKNYKITYEQKKEKIYPFLFGLGGLIFYAFLRGMFLAEKWSEVFGEAILLVIGILLIYGGYKGYQNREQVEFFKSSQELKNVKNLKVVEIKK